MGFLTKRIKDKSKREKVIMIIGVIEVVALLFFALTQKWGWEEGYNRCVNHFCNELIPNYPIQSIQATCFNYTGINKTFAEDEGFP
jgi:hypothetical protein